ncbi:MAG: hypothetical protein IH944_00760 [Armatimonadetes bacterium]|nr:hypothetical protein [Armatimonadota bacterium]
MRWLVVLALSLSTISFAQGPVARATGLSQFLTELSPRELGPTTMGGRVSDLAVYEKDPRIFFVATASGGVWKTTSAGVSFSPVFEKEGSSATGAVAIDQNNPDLVWVGTGEQNSRNSSSWGDGVYKSTDGGATWTNMGLAETKHISEIIIHPENSDIVFIAALGHLWGENEERGIYRTEDGGQTWEKILYEGPRSGFIDLDMSPSDPDTLLAVSWERMRWAYKWASGGESSYIYKSTDGGDTWKKVMDGIPGGDTGRIGISIMHSKPSIVIATVEKAREGTGRDRKQIGGLFKSTNGGNSWEKINDINPRPFYFSMPMQDPLDEDRIYVIATSFHFSEDGGETFKTMSMPIHVDHHAIWINPTDSNHMIIGNDGGVAQTRDRGVTWDHLNNLRAAQFYAIGVDMRKPYWVYGGLQDNGSWAGPTQTMQGGVVSSDFYRVGGGDGFYVQVDPNDWRFVYSESQGGRVNRLNQQTGERRSIRPRVAQGEPRLRFNWSTPIHISPHNSKIIYVGSQYLHRSLDQGDVWQTISPDLTTDDEDKQSPRAGVTPEDTGAERHCTITSISESPITPGLLWVGTDDGNLQMSRDGGHTWTDLTASIPGLPANTWVSRVRASKFNEGRCYVTFDGHRNDDYTPYVYVTDDFGENWENITSTIPDGNSVYVIVEGEQNENFLAVGTEFGLFMSLDRGIIWHRYETGNWPTVRVDDLVIHPRNLDLVIGTHGRALWIVPVDALEQLTNDNLSEDVFLCEPQSVLLLGYTTRRSWSGNRTFVSPNSQPSASIYYFLADATEEDVTITILDAAGEPVAELEGSGDAGLNKVRWVPRRRRRIVEGMYKVVLTVGDLERTTSIRVESVSLQN